MLEAGSWRQVEAERVTGRPRAPEQWPESSGKGLDNQLQVDALALLWAYGGGRERSRLVQGVSWRCREGQRSRTVA